MNDPQSGADDGGVRPSLSRATVLLLAVTCGAAVANIYYAQPLLPVISRALGVSEGAGGLVVTASQIGYAVSLALLVPLGDVRERRRLVSVLLGLSAVALLGAAASPSLGPLYAAVGLVGVTSAVAQIVVPMAASLAADHERGSVVGTVMSGLLVGIMLARTAAGVLAQFGNWRLVFVFAAFVMVVLAVTLRLALRPVPPSETTPYPQLLRSVLTLVRTESLLRRRMGLAAVGMGGFTILWTASSFLLAGPRYGYGPAGIGLFGLAGVVGAAAAVVAGRFADRGHGRQVATWGLVLLTGSWGVLALAGTGGPGGLVALIAGIMALNLAQQALLISHQSALYRRVPHARSRVTTALMVSAFAGSTVSSALASALYPRVGWAGVCALGAAIALIGVGIWVLELRRPSPFEPLADPSAAVDARAVCDGPAATTGRACAHPKETAHA
ncbi:MULTISPECIES: MFS transporter [Streptomyces]|uniref:MFS family arabinose efflux permease n=3 Tax=Streptomyces TaxID=1883 RepID=A0ABT9L8L0_9ACTN|nr:MULTISPECIES: MFS transporter [Streptomyces]MDP9615861.1 putative MFS family arabinose efflux permease [Streptomyces demainii]GHJ33757.1 MFS transporter [Streptomyces hygroscopicus]